MDLRPTLVDWLPLIAESAARTRAIAAAGTLDPDLLTGLADLQAVFAHDLRPHPLAPLVYLGQARDELMGQLRRLRQYDPTRLVHIRSEDGYDYAMTPRKALRRELDHTLDHLNQVEQWLAWQRSGVVPSPTDGWVPSGQMLSDDTLGLSEDELGAWLWRIEISWGLLIQRMAQLSLAQIDWNPPDGGWSLRRVAYHVGRGFYAFWLGEALPDEPAARYEEANRRFENRLRQVIAEPLAPGLGFVGREGRLLTVEESIVAVLAAERHAHAGAATITGRSSALASAASPLHAVAP